MTDQPIITQTEEREIDHAMAGMRQLAREFLPHATGTFQHCDSTWEDMSHEVLFITLTGASRQERHALSQKLIGFIVDSESDVVRRRMAFTIR